MRAVPRFNHIATSCAVAITVAAGTFAACVTTPVTGRKQLIGVPEGYMNQMGATAYDDMRKQEPISKDSALTAKVVDIGERIAKATDKSYEWSFTLFESKDVNAFCLPGGKVGVYTGILPVAKTNAGLAAVLGHEAAHAIARHGAERATQSLLVTGALLTIDQVMSNPQRKQMVMAALGVGAQFGLILPYSRAHESEADAIGLTYMARAGYDPSEAVGLWKRMAALGETPPELLSTHPDPASRSKALEQQLAKVMPLYEQSKKIATVPLL